MKTVAGSHHFVAFSGLASHRGTFPGSSYYLAVESPCAWDFLIKRQGCGAAAFHVHSPPGERERALGSGQPFQCSVESFNISFPILTWKAVSSFYHHETDFAPKQDSIVIITQERSSKFTLCHSHTGHWGHTRFRVQYLLKKNQAGITSRRFPSPQLCFNYLLCIETNPQITQSNSFWFQNLDWYFLFF